MIIDAGYINNSGKYVEQLTYFSFEPTECEKQEILKQTYQEELEDELRKYNEYKIYREPCEIYEDINDSVA